MVDDNIDNFNAWHDDRTIIEIRSISLCEIKNVAAAASGNNGVNGDRIDETIDFSWR